VRISRSDFSASLVHQNIAEGNFLHVSSPPSFLRMRIPDPEGGCGTPPGPPHAERPLKRPDGIITSRCSPVPHRTDPIGGVHGAGPAGNQRAGEAGGAVREPTASKRIDCRSPCGPVEDRDPVSSMIGPAAVPLTSRRCPRDRSPPPPLRGDGGFTRTQGAIHSR